MTIHPPTTFILSGSAIEADALLSALAYRGYAVEYLPSITTMANVRRTVTSSLRARVLRTRGER